MLCPLFVLSVQKTLYSRRSFMPHRCAYTASNEIYKAPFQFFLVGNDTRSADLSLRLRPNNNILRPNKYILRPNKLLLGR